MVASGSTDGAARPLSLFAGRPHRRPTHESETRKNSRQPTSNHIESALGGLPPRGPCSPLGWLQSVVVPGGWLLPTGFHHGGDASADGGGQLWPR